MGVIAMLPSGSVKSHTSPIGFSSEGRLAARVEQLDATSACGPEVAGRFH